MPLACARETPSKPLATGGESFVAVTAVRVVGVQAIDIWAEVNEAYALFAGPVLSTEWMDIDGREVVMVIRKDLEDQPQYLYPKGEVLFMAKVPLDDVLTIEEVLAELREPTRYEDVAPYLGEPRSRIRGCPARLVLDYVHLDLADGRREVIRQVIGGVPGEGTGS